MSKYRLDETIIQYVESEIEWGGITLHALVDRITNFHFWKWDSLTEQDITSEVERLTAAGKIALVQKRVAWRKCGIAVYVPTNQLP